MLNNECHCLVLKKIHCLLAKIGVDTAENEPSLNVWGKAVTCTPDYSPGEYLADGKISKKIRAEGRSVTLPEHDEYGNRLDIIANMHFDGSKNNSVQKYIWNSETVSFQAPGAGGCSRLGLAGPTSATSSEAASIAWAVRTGLNYSFGTKKYCHQILTLLFTEFSQC